WEPTTWYALREARSLDMTEFEWFHWWPFNVLLLAFSIVLVATTFRRIPLNRFTLGVWTIHTGIIILVIGSVIYFSLKLEGDVPIARARLHITAPGHDKPATMLAMPGHSIQVGAGADAWTFRIASIDPAWELLSGEDKGVRAYSVNVAVLGPNPDQRFMRQLILGYPEYTEDLVNSGNPSQPMARAIKVHGTRTIQDDLLIELGPDYHDTFYLMSSAALWLREVDVAEDGAITPRSKWIERPIDDLPRFNDCVVSPSDIWPAFSDAPKVGGLSLDVAPASVDDPLPGVDLRITDYLRAAQLSTRTEPGGDELAPVLRVEFDTSDGRAQEYELFAMTPESSNADPSLMRLDWIEDEADFTRLCSPVPPQLLIQVPDADVESTNVIDVLAEVDPEAPMLDVAGTPYSYRVLRFDDDLIINGRNLSMARVEIARGDDRWLRWVFDDPSLNGDLPLPDGEGSTGMHTDDRLELDTGIVMQYQPGSAPSVPVLFVAGPADDQLRLVTSLVPGEDPKPYTLQIGASLELVQGIRMTPTKYEARTVTTTKPAIVPSRQRDPGLSNQLSMVRVQIPGMAETNDTEAWLAYHHWPFESAVETLRRFIYQPTTVRLSNGKSVQLMLSRASRPLPTPVSLDGFEVASHLGGFTGDTSSVLNWISNIRFGVGENSTPVDVSVNNPGERDGYWFFQSQWDPPDRARFEGDTSSMGLNYTVLGVGNRVGVWTQLAGGTLMTLGMLYAFYIKPVLIRRRQDEAIKMSGDGGST
ncbi:MAG: hypothetical protein MK095_01380, partial [Phycisphaerales bacterium]|nr:hypothetical protein [Phycisphaerales bacterium]